MTLGTQTMILSTSKLRLPTSSLVTKRIFTTPKTKPILKLTQGENGSNHVEVMFTTQGVFAPAMLEGKTESLPHRHHHPPTSDPSPDFSYETIPECGYLKASNSGEGYQSIGWRFSPTKIFDHIKLITFLSGLKVERMKAVFITTKGVFGYNLADIALSELELDDASESRIEIISADMNEDWEETLMACLVENS